MRLALDLDYTTLIPQPDGGFQWYREDPQTWLDFPPADGAIDVLELLHADGHELMFVTARDEHPITKQWLRKHLNCYPYTCVEGQPRKWEEKADLWLDDSPSVLDGLWRRGLCAVKFMRPQNFDAPCSYEVDGWYDFLTLIDSQPDVSVQRRKRSDPFKVRRAARGDRERQKVSA